MRRSSITVPISLLRPSTSGASLTTVTVSVCVPTASEKSTRALRFSESAMLHRKVDDGTRVLGDDTPSPPP